MRIMASPGNGSVSLKGCYNQMMGFLKRLFGGDKKEEEDSNQDKTGLYFYFQCDNCGSLVRVRADKQYDLLNESQGYVWHKTIVDSKCFRRMQTVIHLDRNYQVVNYDLNGGQLLSREAYEAAEATASATGAEAEQPPADDEAG